MSIFDNHKSPESIEKHTQELRIQQFEEELIASYLGFGAHCIEVDDVPAFSQKVVELISPSHAAIDEYLIRQQGRPVKLFDVRACMSRVDAINFLYDVSKMPKVPRPIVIIENITCIPDVEDAIVISNLLLHNWKNSDTLFDEVRIGHFEIKPADFSVLITWSTATSDKMKQMWRASDGLAWCGHWPRE